MNLVRMSVSVSDCFGIDHPSSWSASSLPGPQHIVSGCGRQALAASLRRQEETKTRLVYTAHAELTHGFLSLATLNGGARKVKAETLLALSRSNTITGEGKGICPKIWGRWAEWE